MITSVKYYTEFGHSFTRTLCSRHFAVAYIYKDVRYYVKEAYHICGVQETNQKLRNETGIMRKKFTSLQKEIDDHKEEIRKYQAEISKLNSVIRNLEKDIVGLKKEIQERDETIQDKVCFSIAYYYYCCCCCRCCDVVYFYYRFNSHFINLPYFFV